MVSKMKVLEEFRAAYTTTHWDVALKSVGGECSAIMRRARLVVTVWVGNKNGDEFWWDQRASSREAHSVRDYYYKIKYLAIRWVDMA